MAIPAWNGPSQHRNSWLVPRWLILAPHPCHGKGAERSAVEVAGGNAVQEPRPAACRDGEYRAVGVLGVADPDGGPAGRHLDAVGLAGAVAAGAPTQRRVAPLVHRLDCINYYLTFGDD